MKANTLFSSSQSQSNLLDGIAVFVQVVQSKSFVNAAEKMQHSTSYISKEVSKLETRLGVRLLHRTTRTLSLTSEGEVYYQQCQQIIEDALHVENSLSGRQQIPQGRLKLSCPIGIGVSRIRPILAEFMAKYPKVTLDIDLNDHKVDLIADGFDIVIRAAMQLEDSSLISRRFMNSTSLTLASPEYLTQYGRPKHPDELVDHHMISYRNLKTPETWQYSSQNGQVTQTHVTSRVSCNNSEMMISLCLAGQGIIRMPLFNLREEVATGKLVPLFEDFMPINIGVYLVYPSRKNMPAKVKCFIDFIVDKLGDS
ncbi:MULTISPECIES: LysR family transcriptional regulator [unclassified Colwellia]|jgi:DNA-binding transcriptional LysR family regulator|uniref:LysR family transcriptional regulator n=1 Tax=unclassified Colwellia TaxID=196834 RepID=UPI0015F5A1A4|nr:MULTISPECIES: LysR family transcriptional regulator [unclassified Colwellia]MBA6362537.1 LysR family transcriptional regulator [Colwellia sp. BRX8-8]MBA6339092.1 LysR family transcriptional regulator [Colwellia sp. BRX8-7]MBA6349776.1 LysR family transcriptional regulator [Colwellia sp. BRX8-9]MBA6353770.1 LysR family transcriptional regulator [Colwellia sp. BRX9-1]MBA6357586.1 LysR family transcriptional regulator [Colwellia sp. BRX8-3]